MAVALNGSALTANRDTAASDASLSYASVVLATTDLVVAIIGAQRPSGTFPTLSAPTGGTGLSWTAIGSTVNGAAGHLVSVGAWWTTVPSNQTSTITHTAGGTGGSVGASGVLYRLSGANLTTPVGANATYSNATTDPTGTALQVTGTGSGSMLFLVGADWSDNAAAITVTISGVASTVIDLQHEDVGNAKYDFAHGAQSSSTNAGTLDYTASNGDWAAKLFEITAASGGGSAPIPNYRQYERAALYRASSW